jgi:hypothetical protein
MLKPKHYSEMIKINSQLKKQHGLKLAVVNSEGRELNDNRMKETSLNVFIDFFPSCFSHLHKPDIDIFSDAKCLRASSGGLYIIYLRSA